MPNLNPINNVIPDAINDLDRRLRDLENTRQPNLIDWYELNPSQVSFISATEIGINGLNPADFFAIGDRIHMVQLGIDIYGFISKINASSINIETGVNYTFTSDVISLFEFSDKPYPSGFPGMNSFKKTEDFTFSSFVSFAYTIVKKDVYFFMHGNRVDVNLDYQWTRTSAGSGATLLKAPLPITRSSSDDLLAVDIGNALIYRQNTGGADRYRPARFFTGDFPQYIDIQGFFDQNVVGVDSFGLSNWSDYGGDIFINAGFSYILKN